LNYAGKVVVTEDATLVITLPAVNSVDNSTPSSPNNIGATFRIAIKTTATAVAIKTNGTDKFTGSVLMIDTDSSGAVYGYAPASTNDVINLNGTTTGGLSGSFVDVTVVGPGFYFVSGVLLGSSTVATPFADA
jgi:predicted homoserine dehydrogenase-like protein